MAQKAGDWRYTGAMDKLPEQILNQFERVTDQLQSRQELLDRLSLGRPLRVKFGIDLTAPALHIGHAVNLWLLRDLQDLGHQVVLILGDFTTNVGDPAQRLTARPSLSPEQVAAHADAILEQAKTVLRFDDPNLIEVRRNSEWYDQMPLSFFMTLLRDVTHARLISRDTFQQRIAAQSDLFAHEMLYPVLQGYDSVVVEADIAVIGSDQMFNEMTGRFLQEKNGQAPQSIISTRITAGTDGELKQSKSLGNYIGLSHDARDKFARIMNLPDHLVAQYLRLYTDLPLAEVAAMLVEFEHAPRRLKLRLAEALVSRYHGREAALATSARYEKMIAQLEQRGNMPVVMLYEARLTVLDLVMTARPKLGIEACRRLIEQGLVQINDETFTDPATWVQITTDDILVVDNHEFSRLMVLKLHEFVTEQLVMRPMQVEDLDYIRKYLPQWEIAKYLGLPKTQHNEAVAMEVLKRVIAKPEPKDELLWAVGLRDNPDQLIGVAHLKRDGAQGAQNIWLADTYHGKGYAEQISHAISEYGVGTMGMDGMMFKHAFGHAAAPQEMDVMRERLMKLDAQLLMSRDEPGTNWGFTKDGWIRIRQHLKGIAPGAVAIAGDTAVDRLEHTQLKNTQPLKEDFEKKLAAEKAKAQKPKKAPEPDQPKPKPTA